MVSEKPTFAPNAKALAALQEIAERHKDQPHSDGSDTLRLLREARDRAMYNYNPAEQPVEESGETLDVALADLLEAAKHVQYEVPVALTNLYKKALSEIIEEKYRKMGFDL